MKHHTAVEITNATRGRRHKYAIEFYLADEADIKIDRQQAAIDELICMLERGCKGVSGLLIQTSDQAAVIKWRKESQELINNSGVGNMSKEKRDESELNSLLSVALRAICLTRDYVGEEKLPAIDGWEWYEAGEKLADHLGNDEWANEFRKRVYKYRSLNLGKEQVTTKIYMPVTPGGTVCTWLEAGTENEAWANLMEEGKLLPYPNKAAFIKRGYEVTEADEKLR